MGDLGPWTVLVWSSRACSTCVPDCIDHTYAGAARDGAARRGAHARRRRRGSSRKATRRCSEADHLAFLDHLAALHAAFWGWEDDVGLTPFAEPLLPVQPVDDRLRGGARASRQPVPVIARDGWARLRGARARVPRRCSSR